MFNVGGGELLVIFLVALIVLGPAKLPDVARQIGSVMREVRRISSGFQDEMRAAMDDPVEAAARERGNRVVATSEAPAPAAAPADDPAPDDEAPDDAAPDDGAGSDAGDASDTAPLRSDDDGTDPTALSTAAAAGMYDVEPQRPPSTPNPYLAPVGTRARPSATATPDAADEPDAPHRDAAEDAEAADDTEAGDESVEPVTDESR